MDVVANDLATSDSSSGLKFNSIICDVIILFLFVLNLVSLDSDSSSSGEDEGKETGNLPPSLNLSSCSATSSSEQPNISEHTLPGQDANLLIKRLEDEQVN